MPATQIGQRAMKFWDEITPSVLFLLLQNVGTVGSLEAPLLCPYLSGERAAQAILWHCG